MSEKFPIACQNCGTRLNTRAFHGKGASTENCPEGHKDPRYKNPAVCGDCFGSLKGNTLYPAA